MARAASAPQSSSSQPALRTSKPFVNGDREHGRDFRWLGLGRRLLRDPDAPGWTPGGSVGDTTTSALVAAMWEPRYVAAVQNTAARKQMGIVEVVAAAPGVAVEDAVEDYLDDLKATRKVETSTWYGIQGALRRFVASVGPDVSVSDLRREHVQAYVDGRLRAGYALTSLKTELGHLGPFLAHHDHDDATRRIVLPKLPRKRKHGWTAAQVALARAAADAIDRGAPVRRSVSGSAGKPRRVMEGPANLPFSARLALELALGSGAREGELFAIRWDRMDPRPNWRGVWIEEEASRYAGGLKHTKGKADRFAVFLPDFWAHYDPSGTGLVLHDGAGGLVLQGHARKVLIYIMEMAGLKAVGEANHMTRHTYSRVFLETCGARGINGLPLLQISLGHKSQRTTEDSYGHYVGPITREHAINALYPADHPLALARSA